MKKKGYFLIDVLFSITLIMIISIYLFPTILNSIKQNNIISKNKEDIYYINSLMEEIISKNYTKKDYRDIEVKDGYKVEFIDLDSDLILVKVIKVQKEGDITIEEILSKKGIYTN